LAGLPGSVAAGTIPGPWVSSRRGSAPMLTAWTIWNGCAGRRGPERRTAGSSRWRSRGLFSDCQSLSASAPHVPAVRVGRVSRRGFAATHMFAATRRGFRRSRPRPGAPDGTAADCDRGPKDNPTAPPARSGSTVSRRRASSMSWRAQAGFPESRLIPRPLGHAADSERDDADLAKPRPKHPGAR